MKNSTESTELLPCPFCGVKPELLLYDSKSFGKNWQVECHNIDCPVETATCAYTSSERAVMKWNTRHTIPKPTPQGTESAFEAYCNRHFWTASRKDDCLHLWQAALRESNAEIVEIASQVVKEFESNIGSTPLLSANARIKSIEWLREALARYQKENVNADQK